MKIEFCDLTDSQFSHIREKYDSQEVVDILGVKGILVGYNSFYSCLTGRISLSLDVAFVCENKIAPETEEEKQLKHINKLHEQDIEHKKRLIANNEAKLKQLQKKREGA